jgi:hypothetical protein
MELNGINQNIVQNGDYFFKKCIVFLKIALKEDLQVRQYTQFSYSIMYAYFEIHYTQ